MAGFFRGKNKNKSREMWLNRSFYGVLAWRQHDAFNTDMISNFWTPDGILYGRVNPLGQPVLPNRKKMKGVPSDGKKVLYALDFVADAFIDLQAHVQNSIQTGCLPATNPDGSVEPYLAPIQAVRAYTPISTSYGKYMGSIYSNFYNAFLENLGKTRKVTNFDDFIKTFMEYSRYGLGTSVPFLKANYAVSPYSSILASGLTIDIADEDAGDDAVKEEKFLDNPRLTFYKDVAEYYGFLIDMNVPWRLVANLQSPQLKEYILRRYPEYTDIQSLFDHYYISLAGEDFESMKKYFVSFYNRLCRDRPRTLHASDRGASIVFERIDRHPIAAEMVETDYDNSYWLELYIRLKNNESYISYSRAAEAEIIKNAQDLEKTIDLQRAIGYIEYKFKNTIAVPSSTPNQQVMTSLADEDMTLEEKRERARLLAQATNTVVY